MQIFQSLAIMLTVIFVAACSAHIDERTPPTGDDSTGVNPPVSGSRPDSGQGNSVPGTNPGTHDPSDPYTVHGRWNISVSAGESAIHFLASQSSFPVASTVAPTVNFTVDDSLFAVPASIEEGDVSFGEFSLNRLRDNKMRVCGASGNDRCVEAAIRVYTQGTPDAGFWNAEDAYGAPITSGGYDVGLDAASAAIVATYAIPAGKRVVKLKDFTGDNAVPLAIPISVNFDDAGAGPYSSEFVVEYVLR
jgi:hypothetical protein